jgi:hypothetical protein
MKKRLALAAFVLAALAAAGAGAQSLRSLRAQESDAGALAREVAYTSSVCGSNISASIDWSASSAWPESQSLAGACDQALGALETLCRSGRGMGRVATFICAGDGSGPSLRGSTFRFGASPGGDGYSSALIYLEGAL